MQGSKRSDVLAYHSQQLSQTRKLVAWECLCFGMRYVKERNKAVVEGSMPEVAVEEIVEPHWGREEHEKDPAEQALLAVHVDHVVTCS